MYLCNQFREKPQVQSHVNDREISKYRNYRERNIKKTIVIIAPKWGASGQKWLGPALKATLMVGSQITKNFESLAWHARSRLSSTYTVAPISIAYKAEALVDFSSLGLNSHSNNTIPTPNE